MPFNLTFYVVSNNVTTYNVIWINATLAVNSLIGTAVVITIPKIENPDLQIQDDLVHKTNKTHTDQSEDDDMIDRLDVQRHTKNFKDSRSLLH